MGAGIMEMRRLRWAKSRKGFDDGIALFEQMKYKTHPIQGRQVAPSCLEKSNKVADEEKTQAAPPPQFWNSFSVCVLQESSPSKMIPNFGTTRC